MNQQKLTLSLLAFLALSLLGGLFGINRSLSKLSAETNSIKQTVAEIKNQPSPTATPTPAAPSVKLNQGWDKVDAHEQPKAGSQIVGQLKTGLAYPLVGKQSGWYQIKLENNALAWIQSQFVYESN